MAELTPLAVGPERQLPCAAWHRTGASARQGKPFTASMPTLRRAWCGRAPQPASAGSPKAQGLTAPRRRGTIDDAVNREHVVADATEAGPDGRFRIRIYITP